MSNYCLHDITPEWCADCADKARGNGGVQIVNVNNDITLMGPVEQEPELWRLRAQNGFGFVAQPDGQMSPDGVKAAATKSDAAPAKEHISHASKHGSWVTDERDGTFRPIDPTGELAVQNVMVAAAMLRGVQPVTPDDTVQPVRYTTINGMRWADWGNDVLTPAPLARHAWVHGPYVAGVGPAL